MDKKISVMMLIILYNYRYEIDRDHWDYGWEAV